MPDAAPAPAPLWLRAVFVLEGLGWLVQAALAAFFTFYASAFPERVLEIAYLALQLLGALAAAGVFVAGIVLPMRRSAAARFATTHAGASLAVGIPVTLLLGSTVAARIEASDWGNAASTGLFALLFVAVPLAGLLAGRSERAPLVVFAAVGGLLWLALCAFVLIGAGVGVAGVSA